MSPINNLHTTTPWIAGTTKGCHSPAAAFLNLWTSVSANCLQIAATFPGDLAEKTAPFAIVQSANGRRVFTQAPDTYSTLLYFGHARCWLVGYIGAWLCGRKTTSSPLQSRLTAFTFSSRMRSLRQSSIEDIIALSSRYAVGVFSPWLPCPKA